jgi:hypothetical protein
MTWNISFRNNYAAYATGEIIDNQPQPLGIQLAFSAVVKTILIKLLLNVGLLACCAAAVAQTQTTATLSPADKQIADAFEKRVKAYAKLRENQEAQMPKLSTEAKPEEIQTHKQQFQDRVRAARAGAKHGEMFTPEAQALIRRIIKDEFKGKERAEFRETVLKEAETKAVALRVNYPYPEAGELLEMPATLLLRLPQLPKQVRYRFVGRNFLLVDRENGLIVDYMTNALP